MFFGVGVCMLMVSSGIAFGRRVSTVTAACTGLVLCCAPLALAMALRANIEYSLVTVFRDPVTNEMPQGALGHSNGVGTATLEWIEHTVQYRLPFVVTVGSLFLLLCLLGIELRYAVERRSRQPRAIKSANPLSNVAWWLTAGAVILAFSAAALSLYFLDDPYVFDNTIRSQSAVTTAVIGLTGQFLCFPIFVLALLAANSLRHGHHGKLAVAACAAFFIPVTPGWFLTMPIGAWCLSVLYRQNGGLLWSSGTPREPAGKKERAAATPVDRVAAWLRRGAIELVGSAVVTLVVLIAIIAGTHRAYRGDEEVLMTLCAAQVLCFPLAVAAFARRCLIPGRVKNISMTFRQRLLVTAVLISLVVQANFAAARADQIGDGEREFVQQLQTRQFFDLAEQFCVRQSESGRTPDERAAWQIMLADCREQHAWTLQDPGRTEILTHAVESITQFVRKESPGAELDLLLRVRQIEILSSIAVIDATCSEFGPKIAPQPLAVQAIAEGLQLAEAMLVQIDQIRKDIESDVARAARDRTRYVVAELLLMQARQNPTDAAIRARAATAAEQLMKSSSDNEMRFRARRLLAESLLDRKDVRGFDLLVTSLTSMAENEAQQFAVATAKIRGLLRRDQPSEALQLCLDFEKQALRSEELSTLRLAALLNLYELLHQLDAPDLRQKTADEFRLLNRRLGTGSKGVWRDCCERIALRFSHVEKFGPEAATAVESVADLIAAGDFAAARKSLLDMRSAFERTNPPMAATLSMQAGDLAIRLNDWPAAETDLDSAVRLFRTAQNQEQEAASDLLRIYAMGRHWDGEVSAAIEIRNALEAAYRTALERHIADYADAATKAKAREWRAMLIRATDPVAAADELLELTNDTTNDASLLLIQAGEILIEVQYDSHTTATVIDADRWTAAVKAWGLRAEEMLAKPVESTPLTPLEIWVRPALEIQRLMFSLQRRWPASEDWTKLAADTELQLGALATFKAPDVAAAKATGFPGERQTQLTSAIANGHALMALAGCRQLLGFDAMQVSREVLSGQSRDKRRQLAKFLLHQASETHDPIPGDPQLGFLALDLLSEKDSTTMSVDRQLELLPMLLEASKVADNFQRLDAVIVELTAKSLTDAQLLATASILERRTALKSTDSTSSDSTETFWQAVLKRSRSGDDQWLEASLQLATIATQKKNLKDALKVLNVIDALHPDWGTSERKTRATALKARLESAR